MTERKARWRKVAAQIFSLVPPESRAGLDAKIVDNLSRLVAPLRPRWIFGYFPMPDEPDLVPFYRHWLAGGGGLGLPVWDGKSGMRIRRVTCLESGLRPGAGGIFEPVPECPEMDADAIDLVIAPGRVFSEGGDRLGRGAGCYDRFLHRRAVTVVGAAYDFQIFPAIPKGGHDAPMNAIVTPSRILRPEQDGSGS